MDVMGFLRFSLIYSIEILAWPLCALGYPLYASIRAIETKSDSDTKKLVTYWILFSLISLFEYAFEKILTWFPSWIYIKLMIVCWLAIPHFEGAFYVYEHLVRPCLLMNSRIVILWINEGKDTKQISDFLVKAGKYEKDNGDEAIKKLLSSKGKDMKQISDFVVEAEKYVKDNGDEAIEKFVSTKGKDTKQISDFLVEDEKYVKDNGDEAIEKFVSSKEAYVPASIEKRDRLASPAPRTMDMAEKMELAAPAGKQVSLIGPYFSQTERQIIRDIKVKELSVVAEAGIELSPDSKKVQKEWTCAICQVTTSSETTLKSHLRGLRHKANYEELKAKNQKSKNKCPSPTSVAKKPDQSKVGAKVQGLQKKSKECLATKKRPFCKICNIWCSDEGNLICHNNGSKHRARVLLMVSEAKN